MAGIIGLKLFNDNNITKNFFDFDFLSRKNVNQWIIYKFTNDDTIKCDIVGDRWSNMIGYLPTNDVRFVISNFSYISPIDQVERVKRVFLMWAPDSAKVKDKLKITMFSKDAQKILGMGSGFHINVQANELSDVDEENILHKIQKNSTVY